MNEQWCNQISQDIGYIKGCIEPLVENQKAHDRRLDKLEGFKHILVGIAVAVSFIFNTIINFVKGGQHS